MDCGTFREGMMLSDGVVYLNHASIGPLHRRTFEKAEHGLRQKASLAGLAFTLDDLMRDWETLTKTGAEFIQGKPHELSFPFSTTTTLSMIAEGLDYKRGGNIVVTDMEFTSNSYCHQVVARKQKQELRVVENIHGILPIDAFEKKIDKDTRLVAVSHVQFSNGYKTDLRQLKDIVDDKTSEGILLVDAIQSLGTEPISARKSGADVISAGGYKWLLSPFGTGIAWVREELISQANPCFAPWWSDENWRNMAHHTYKAVEHGMKFQPTLNPELMALEESLSMFNTLDLGKVSHCLLKVLNRLENRAAESTTFNIADEFEVENKGPIRRLRINDESVDVASVVEALAQRRIAVSLRMGTIRVSPHFYNTEEEIDRFADSLEEEIRVRSR